MANVYRDLHNNVKVNSLGVYPQAVGTTGAANGVTTGIIDRRGYGGVEFIFGYGTIPSTTETITPVVLECATTGGTFTSVADADLIGTEAAAGIAAGTRTSGSTKNTFKSVGYKGNQPYVKAKLYGVGTATALVSIIPVLHTPRSLPPA